jgi:hypothetical protein
MAPTTPRIRAEIHDNGMVERSNGRISEVVQQTRFASGVELDTEWA